MKFLRRLILALLLHTLAPDPSYACSCVVTPGRDQPCLSMSGRVVFSGRVDSIEVDTYFSSNGEREGSRPMRRVRFEVEEAFAGVDDRTIEVWTGFGGGDCGFEFEEGGRYFVYAYPVPETGTLHAGICNRTRALAQASEDLAYARLFKAGQAKTRILGGAFHYLPAADGDGSTAEPVAGARIRAQGPGGAVAVATADAEGEFVLEVPKGGRYEIEAEMPPGLPAAEPITVEVESGTCAGATLQATSLAAIEGTVLTLE